MDDWQNRIVGYGEEEPGQLLANPRNWRIHPKNQQDALEASLDEVGIVDTVKVNRNTGFVVDGHLRVAMAITRGQEKLPVTYLDLTEEEELLMLTIFDPITAMAAADKEKQGENIREVRENTESEAVREMLEAIVRERESEEREPRTITCPECGCVIPLDGKGRFDG